jgi:DNA-directed RNA polymerase specialized sigma24 family protein
MATNLHNRMEYNRALVRNLNRDGLEGALQFAPFLPDKDRYLITAYVASGASVYQLAKERGVPRSNLRHHLHTVLKRLANPLFRLTVLAEQHSPNEIGQLCRDLYLAGLSHKEISQMYALTLQQVRDRIRMARYLLSQFALALPAPDQPYSGMNLKRGVVAISLRPGKY